MTPSIEYALENRAASSRLRWWRSTDVTMENGVLRFKRYETELCTAPKSPTILEQFLELADPENDNHQATHAEAEAIHRFAQRWGMLYPVVDRNARILFRPDEDNEKIQTTTTPTEYVSLWRVASRAYRSAVIVARMIADGEPPPFRELFWIRWWGGAMLSKDHFEDLWDSMADHLQEPPADLVVNFVRGQMHQAALTHPRPINRDGRWQFEYPPIPEGGLSSALALELATVLSGARLRKCNECGDTFWIPTRDEDGERRPGRPREYCGESCRRSANRRSERTKKQKWREKQRKEEGKNAQKKSTTKKTRKR